MRAQRIRTTLALATLCALVAVPLPGGPAAADCGPSVLSFADGRVEPRLVPGETVSVTAAGYVDDCDDGGDADDGGWGCAPRGRQSRFAT